MENQYNKAGGYISEIRFNNGSALQIKKNDIVVFVGPNNVGKSQALSDLYTLCDDNKPTIVIKDIRIKKSSSELVEEFLNKTAITISRGSHVEYLGYGFSFNSHAVERFGVEKYYKQVKNAFVSYLNTEERLNISKPPNVINRNEQKLHPIHNVAFEHEYRKLISSYFKKAFGIGIVPNTQFGRTIPLCLSEPIALVGDYSDEQERLEEYGDKLLGCKQVHLQGDGIRSFTGILLNLIIDHYCTFLIDEPESFLHPPQARIMGNVIGEILNDEQQAFISTHSQDIIKGLLVVKPERVKIIRITREDDQNYFSVLENESIQEVWRDSLLKHSNIMDGLFHKSVVLCESDSDCKMYSIIDSFLQEERGKYPEALFIHCGGKDRMPKVISVLKSLSVEFKVIPDIDVLNNENTIKDIFENCGGDWSLLSNEYIIFISSIDSNEEQIERDSLLESINKILSKNTGKFVAKDELEQLKRLIKVKSKWKTLKSVGESAIPSGDATQSYNKIKYALKEKGIYIVTNGELEGFIKLVGGHGPNWVNEVLEKYPDLNDKVYDLIKEFVSSIGI